MSISPEDEPAAEDPRAERPGTSPTEGTTLGDALPREMARVRGVRDVYLTFPGGVFAGALMNRDLDAAARALASGDVVAMLRAHEALKGWTL